MNGLSFEKLMIIAVIAALIIGPEKLPVLAEGLAKLVKKFKSWWTEAGKNLESELGEEINLKHLTELDPRKLDPRAIIRDAWYEDERPAQRELPEQASAAAERQSAAASGLATPFDSEAT